MLLDLDGEELELVYGAVQGIKSARLHKAIVYELARSSVTGAPPDTVEIDKSVAPTVQEERLILRVTSKVFEALVETDPARASASIRCETPPSDPRTKEEKQRDRRAMGFSGEGDPN